MLQRSGLEIQKWWLFYFCSSYIVDLTYRQYKSTATMYFSIPIQVTAAWLAQLVECQSVVREVDCDMCGILIQVQGVT